MEINIEDILALADRTIFRRGVDYFHAGRVVLTHVEPDAFEAVVDGTYHYHVSVEHDEDGFWPDCDCPYPNVCKHVVAAMLAAREHYAKNNQPAIQKAPVTWQSLFDPVTQNNNRPGPYDGYEKWRLIYILQLEVHSWRLIPKKQYIKKDGSTGRIGNIQTIDPEDKSLSYAPNDPLILSYLKRPEALERRHYYNAVWESYNMYTETAVLSYGQDMGTVIRLLRDSRVFQEVDEDILEPVSFDAEPHTVDFRFIEEPASYDLTATLIHGAICEPMDATYQVLTSNPVFLLHNKKIVEIHNLDHTDLLSLFAKGQARISIPKTEFPKFIESVYPHLQSRDLIRLPEAIPVSVVSQMTGKTLHLAEKEGALHITFMPQYGEALLAHDEIREKLTTMENGVILMIDRDQQAEFEARKQLMESGLRMNKDSTFSIMGQKGMDWFFLALPGLKDKGFQVIGWNELKNYKVRTAAPKIQVQVSSQIDWFDLNLEIDIEGILLSIKELKKSLKAKSRFVKLQDGSYGRLSDEWVSRFEKLFHYAGQKEDGFQAKRIHVTLIDQLFAEAESFQADADYERMLKRLSRFDSIQKQTLPASLFKTLRPYQEAGVDWLYFLQEFGFGGCLADDMGLGKTLQALAVLLKDKQAGEPGPSLIVCPTSVVFNWQKEIGKFTPELTVYVHTGNNRSKDLDMLREFNVVLTSYGILLRDVEFLKKLHFHYIIMDESQKIKNPASQSAKAARILNGNHKLALTGTPVENNTKELWSQFAFLNPGFLGSLLHFKHNFTTPIEKHGEQQTADMLQSIVFPFILRRTKEHVAKELPPKMEQTYFCDMSPAQQKVYNHWRDFYRGMLLNKIDEQGFDKTRMNILEGLVKLRQIACHPGLVDAGSQAESGKMETLKEFIDEITSEGHKILIFSQFVKMLKIIREFCDAEQFKYAYLDGRTRNREACVEEFQTDDSIKLFLISLKAGGTGLNLTAADYVIHVDPWWNPAVEAQATDRAHRIGQDKKVIVYKLISRDTVEEKMLELQERKRVLVKNLIGTDEGLMKNLTREDVEILFG